MPRSSPFLFTTSFDDAAAVKEPVLKPDSVTVEIAAAPETTPEPEQPPEPTFSAEDIDVARQLAFQEGHAAGTSEARALLEGRQTDYLRRISEQLAFLEEASSEAAEQFVSDAVATARALVAALSPQLVEMGKDREIAALLEQCMHGLALEKTLLIRCCPADEELVRELANRIRLQSGCIAALDIMTDEAMENGDIIVQWPEGRASRLQSDIRQRIDAVLAKIG